AGKPARTTVQAMQFRMVRVDLVANAVEGKAPVTNAVGVAADSGAEIGLVRKIGFAIFEAEDQRGGVIMQAQILHHRAPVQDFGGKAAGGYGKPPDVLSVKGTEDFAIRHLRGP